jgi:hypothetical protein
LIVALFNSAREKNLIKPMATSIARISLAFGFVMKAILIRYSGTRLAIFATFFKAELAAVSSYICVFTSAPNFLVASAFYLPYFRYRVLHLHYQNRPKTDLFLSDASASQSALNVLTGVL